MKTLEQQALELFLPKGIFEWFDVVDSYADEENIKLTLQEKNNPPRTELTQNKQIEPRGFTHITITDFPARGKRVLITFKRRYWQVDGETEYLKRDIKFNFPGTQLEKEFAVFLKEDSGRHTGLASFYRRVSLPPDQRV
jgi:hypothetical protein